MEEIEELYRIGRAVINELYVQLVGHKGMSLIMEEQYVYVAMHRSSLDWIRSRLYPNGKMETRIFVDGDDILTEEAPFENKSDIVGNLCRAWERLREETQWINT